MMLQQKKVYIFMFSLVMKSILISVHLTESQKRSAYEKQNGICKNCGKHFDIKEMEADLYNSLASGGKTSVDNCQCY